MIINFVSKVLSGYNLSVNKEKIRVMHKHQRQEVTGIVVNKSMQASRDIRRELRKIKYFIQKYGLYSHMDRLKIDRSRYLEHLIGLANFVLFINPKDKVAQDLISNLQQYK